MEQANQTHSNYTMTIKPSTQPVRWPIKKAVGIVSALHLNKKLPGEPEIPQGTRVTGTGASGCNHTGMKEELKACQLHSQQAG